MAPQRLLNPTFLKRLCALACASFESAAKKAAQDNDAQNIFTPVGQGEDLQFVMNTPLWDDPVLPPPNADGLFADDEVWMFIVAGPNAVGKTTFVSHFLKNLHYEKLIKLNADEKTLELRQTKENTGKTLDEVNLLAAKETDASVFNCIETDQSFLIETVLSSEKYKKAVHEAKRKGFRMCFIYVSGYPAAISPARVNVRVRKKGHNVPSEKALSRYERSHQLAPWFAQNSDIFMAFHNSNKNRKPVLTTAIDLQNKAPLYHRQKINRKLDEIVESMAGSSSAPTGPTPR